MKKVSFVIPCYRSEHTLPHVVKEIREKMQELTQYEYDIFLVNDASPDNTMGTIRDLCDKYENIKGIGFARNFGQHAALMAGLRHSDGDYVVCLDDDGQTPADEVDKLLGKLEEGFDAVYASYEHKQHSAFRNMGSKVNELMTRMMLDKPADLYISSYFAVKFRIYIEKAAGLMVQRIYRILGETAADCHYTGCGMCRYGLSLWNLYHYQASGES